MTAAPAMLAALADLVAILESPQNSVRIPHEARGQYDVTLREAREAIAKATGA